MKTNPSIPSSSDPDCHNSSTCNYDSNSQQQLNHQDGRLPYSLSSPHVATVASPVHSPPRTMVTPSLVQATAAPLTRPEDSTPMKYHVNTSKCCTGSHHHPATSLSLFDYVLVILRRPSLQHKWGLTLALHPEQGLVEVSDSSSSSSANDGVKKNPRMAWCTKAPHRPDWWWQHTTTTTTTTLIDGTNIILEQFTKAYSWRNVPEENIHFPSGYKYTMVSINGTVLPGPCQSMKQVMQVCQQSLQLCMLLVRSPPNLLQVPLIVLSPSSWTGDVTPPRHRALSASSSASAAVVVTPMAPHKSTAKKVSDGHKSPIRAKVPFVLFRNALFRDPNDASMKLPFADDLEHEPDDGKRAGLFIRPITDVTSWIQQRKRKWRETYQVRSIPELWTIKEGRVTAGQSEEHHHPVPTDFWTPQGFANFSDWLHARTGQWRQSYSWQRVKRQRIKNDVENPQSVSLTRDFEAWLRVRKTQWRLARRQRQRATMMAMIDSLSKEPAKRKTQQALSGVMVSTEDFVMDSLLQEKEEKERQRQERPPPDISWLFDVDLGCPDDVVAHCVSYIPAEEHGKLLALNRRTRSKFSQRETVWRLLCPTNWNMPRRPRQHWHILYWTKLKAERQEIRKQGDDLLSRALNIVARGDHLSSLERIVKKAEKDNKFDVNYASGVVCERNSLLNLAVIHERHKICRWLVEVKGADIESEDRGQFTPLLNAAWAGDRVLVRFLLAHGANRKHVGLSHYTRPLAPPDFEGKTADEWADHRGHTEVAELIRLGL